MRAVLHSFAYSLDFVRELLDDVPDELMTHQPTGIPNHASWTVGHLTYSCQAIGGEIGMPEWLPGDYRLKFGTGSKPQAERNQYAPKSEALEELRSSAELVAKVVGQLTSEQLDCPLPDERFRLILPTIRHALTQVLVGHTGNHVGQLSLWRRASGFSPLSRPFA